ncbi:MAG: hypothetical protein NUV93_03895, partial [Firmicutes bacterium]|nr:hypothetical protein [Bacillota bacterium]
MERRGAVCTGMAPVARPTKGGNPRLAELVRATGKMGFPAAALGFMMGRAVILGSLSPFGLSYIAALGCLWPDRVIPGALAVLVGGATGASAGDLMQAVGGAALLCLMMKCVRSPKGAGRVARISGAALVARVTVRITLLMLGEWSPYTLLVAVLEGLLCSALTVIFAFGLRALESGSPLDRPYSTEEITCAAAVCACAIAGVGGLRVGPLIVKNVIGGALTAVVGYAGGSTAGAAAGVAFGLISSLSGTSEPGFVGVQALSGLMAGMFRDLGRFGSFSGFLLGSVAMSLYTGSPGALVRVMLESLAGSALVLVVPERTVAALRALVGPTAPPIAAREQLAKCAVDRLRSYSTAMREISRAFEQVCGTPAHDSDKMPRMFGSLAARVCDRCQDYRRCWEAEFRGTYRGIFELIRSAEEGGSLTPDSVETSAGLRCRFPDRLALCVNHLVEVEHLARRCQRRILEGREILGGQMRMISRLIDGVAGELLAGSPPPVAPGRRSLTYSAGVAQAPKRGFDVSGDSALVREIGDGRLLVALSDGMGA